MFQRIRFYVMYALRNIQRGGRWTTLAVLCITAGVATVVALRSLGLAVGDTLTNNVRIEIKGDLLIRNDAIFGGFGSNDPNAFSPAELGALLAWAADEGAQASAYMSGRNMQLTPIDASQFGRPSFIGSNFIDPQTYPPTHTIRALDPPDAPLATLFTGGNDVVISDNLAASSDLAVGDSVRVSGTEELFTVRGIVSVAEESSVTNFLNAFFGFAYFDLANAQVAINAEFAPNRIGVLFPGGVSDEQLVVYGAEIEALVPGAQTTVIADFLERYEVISQYLSDFVVVMGLGALLIGGVGIMNTMLVLVRRRTAEIAAVKTFGLQGRQVAALFLTEGLLLGLLGSLLGMLVGIGLSVIVNEYGSVALRQPLVWRVYPEALGFGFVLGIVVTAIFGVAPVLTAVQVRPSVILRPNENHLVTLGLLQSVALLVFVIISLGLVTGHIVRPSFELTVERMAERAESPESIDEFAESRRFAGAQEPPVESLPSPYLVGVAGVSAVFVLFAVMIGALWLIVFVIGKLPTLGIVTARLALRNLSTNRLRTAITLLALSAGMMALSSIAFVGEGTRELLNLQLSRSFGGNVLVFAFPGLPQSLVANGINNAVADVPVDYRTTIKFYDAELRSINGQSLSDASPVEFTSWDSDKPDIYSGQPGVRAGRMLMPADRGAPLLVLPAASADLLELQVGDRVTLDIAGDRELEVIGITTADDGFGFGGEAGLIPPDTLPNSAASTFSMYSFQVPNEFLNQALAELSTLIFALAIDVQFIDGLIGRLIDQFAAIPTIVGILSLFAAAVIMANTVALSTLERRRQIGILKAIGLKSRRVLSVMFIESSLIGLLSAGIGIGLSAAIITSLGASGGIVIPLPTDARLVAAGLLVAAVLIGWTATFLSARVALQERVMNVLRYD
ncbi:MAG: ABC transporter permease [Chloroflexi bacterium]|nr:ABC transporter permease [Chloroflexota bacterium]MCY3582369.1 ABC transporter permease [Chloroflexota bacterium]MCY3717079.1 ABC transporter permease [Chloroflexota bacterium]MDE2650783.1 ABC transporter permease [Chloroflexota bacterium]MXV93659.1 FtsX-like permease family protein [Chloroflexota bacterium]